MAEKVCPHLEATFEALEFIAYAAKRNDPACEEAAKRHVAQQRASMPTAWCIAAETIVNVDATKPYLKRR